MIACDAGAYPASPKPTSARQMNSCQNRLTKPPAVVAALHTATPHVITLRRERRSPMTPSGSAATDSTITYADASHPNWASEMWRSCLTGSNTTSRSEEHTSELQSPYDLVCRLLLEKKKTKKNT